MKHGLGETGSVRSRETENRGRDPRALHDRELLLENLTKRRYGVSTEEGQLYMYTSFGISSVLSQSVGDERPEIGNFSRSLGLSDVDFDRS